MNGLVALKGSWIKAIIILCVIALLGFGIIKLDDAYRLIFNVPRFTSDNYININVWSFVVAAVFTVVWFLVFVPLVFGMLEWYWNLTGGKPTGVGDIFAWYGSLRLYLKSLQLTLNVFLRSLLWWIITCGIPSVMIYASCYYARGIDLNQTDFSAQQIQNLLVSGILMLFGILLLLGGAILFIFIVSRYLLAFFLIVEDSSIKVSVAIKNSIEYSREYRWEMTKFILSFVGWAIFCLALFPVLFVVPYFCSSMSIFSKHIIYTQRAKISGGNVAKTSEE
jgi:hypothetical protein